MAHLINRYARWLHTRWPAGEVERLPVIRKDGSTNVPGVFVTGDLTGIPLLKFALDSGARAARRVAEDLVREGADGDGTQILDLVIIGGGVSGLAAAVEARARGLRFEIIEAAEPLSTLVQFPRRKPIFTYPSDMTPAGTLQVSADVKERLVDELRAQVERAGVRPRRGRAERIERTSGGLTVHIAGGSELRTRRVIVAIGRSGDFRRLGVPGENLDKVTHRLHDPREFRGRRVLVVGGGDSAVETAVALARAGAAVTLSVRGTGLSRCKRENVALVDELEGSEAGAPAPSATGQPGPASGEAGREKAAEPGTIRVVLASRVLEIRRDAVLLAHADGREETLANDDVFTMIGREPPLGFLRRSGIAIAGEMTAGTWTALGLFLVFCAWLYNWKSGGFFSNVWYEQGWFPTNLPSLLDTFGGAVAAAAHDPSTLLGTLAISAAGPAFWYTLAYSLVVVIFGIRRVRRRRTPYVTAQTLTLMSVQVLPLFLIPEIVLPLLHHNGWLPAPLADALFPAVTYGHGREFWRAYGFILAWPLNVYNVFTSEPLWWWIGISIVQTLVLIPLGIHFFGKGVYCGWICSCGALAETLGDTHRHKMPHGPVWNRLNMAGQLILAVAVLLLLLRIVGWALPTGNAAAGVFDLFKESYKWWVDVLLAGVVGYGLYFWFSGRVWCRFLCPLAALMHVYARFSRFRILADKKKCISCNQCTAVCHQGIDVMSFANKGDPMADPECVRCSACVQVCPTGVLSFAQVGASGDVISVDALPASPARMKERR